MELILDLVGGVQEKTIELDGIVIKMEQTAHTGQAGMLQKMNTMNVALIIIMFV